MADVSKIKLPNNTEVNIKDARIAGVDTTVTSGSGNVVTSGAVYNAIDALDEQVWEAVTYSELVALRSGGNLTPGKYYRITDYVTTTSDSESRSVGNQYDVIVLAIDESHLSEEAHAAHHSGDTYFANSNLDVWRLWYCLDNDTTRFTWADTTNGKGVVYRMIDEYGNDVPYDFKNIQFKRYEVTAESTYSETLGQLGGLCIGESITRGFTIDTSVYDWYYTFTLLGNTFDADKTDGSLSGNARNVTFKGAIRWPGLLNNVFADGPAAETLHNNLGLTLSSANYSIIADEVTLESTNNHLTVIGDICHSRGESEVRRTLIVGSARHNYFKTDFQDNTLIGDYIFNDFHLSENIFFVTRSMQRNIIGRASGNYFYVNGGIFGNQGLYIVDNTIIISDYVDYAINRNDFGRHFEANQITKRFSYNIINYNFKFNVIHAEVQGCEFNSIQHRYMEINNNCTCCVFTGVFEYAIIPQKTNLTFAYNQVGPLRGTSDSKIQLGNDNFYVSSVAGTKRRVVIEGNNDGEIIATWRDADGLETGVYATAAESRSGTWHTLSGGGGGDTNVIETVKVNGAALTPDANKAVDVSVPISVYTFQMNDATDARLGEITVNYDTYQSFVDDLDNGRTIVLRTECIYNGNVEFGFDWKLLVWEDGTFFFRRPGTGLDIDTYYGIFVYAPSSSGSNAGVSPYSDTIGGGGSGDLPTPTGTGLFLETYYDSTSRTNKWGISQTISYGSGFLDLSSGNDFFGDRFVTHSGPQGNASNILIDNQGLVGEARNSQSVFSDWSWIKYRSSYSPSAYVTLQDYLNKRVLPEAVSGYYGTIPTVVYDSTNGYHWGGSDFYISSGCLYSANYGGFRAYVNSSGDFIDFGANNGGLFCSYASDWSWIKFPRSGYTGGYTLQDTLDLKAPLASPALTGVPTAPTAASGTNTTQIATTAFVSTAASGKQDTLVSGTNIKTINNESILGSGNITIQGGGGSTTDCVHKTGDETVGGDKTFTDDIIIGDASNIKYGASAGSGFTRGETTTYMDDSSHALSFEVEGEPKAFVLSCHDAPFNYDTFGVLMVVGDSTGVHGIYNTGSQHNYSASFTKSYSNGTLTVTAPTGVDFGDIIYSLVYYYGEGTLAFNTAQVTPGSGVTSVTFTGTGLTEVPEMYATFLETAVNNESYRRVAGYTNSAYSGSADVAKGITFLTGGPTNTTSSFTVSYNNGLVINSGGTNAGGYFHNPGTYTLYYLMASDIGGGGSGTYSDLSDELSAMSAEISAKQDALVSGTNIKTINSTSLLGSGNINIASLPTVTTTNNGQILEVSNGAWAAGRTITISSSEPTAYQGNNGDIWIVI